METESKKEPHRKISLIVLIGIILVFIIYYSVMSALSPSHKLEEIKKEYGAKTSEKNDSDTKITTDSAYLKLLKEKSFLQSRVVMAQTDSIYLTVNLDDSTANLEISGVAVHKERPGND